MSEQLAPGTIVDQRYEIIARIGAGGMGTVYKAWEAALNRAVALKVLLSTGVHTDEAIARFSREAKAISALSHRNIAVLYRFAVWREEVPYMAMEFLEGKSLQQILDQCHHLEPARAAKIASEVCAGLAHAHSRGVIHRDLKPHNIMILQDKSSETPKVVDFGLAALNAPSTADGMKLTATGMLLGSAHYMSPEQCQGKKADERSDIYSLGCVIYECLAGRPPFTADNSILLLHMHVAEQPVPFAEHPDLGKIPEDLQNVAFKALAKQPGDRYQSMADMGRDLESFLRNEPVRALPESTRKGKTRAVPLRLQPVIAVALLLCFALVVVVVYGNEPLLAASSERILSLSGELSAERRLQLARWLHALGHRQAAEISLGNVGSEPHAREVAKAASAAGDESQSKVLADAILFRGELAGSTAKDYFRLGQNAARYAHWIITKHGAARPISYAALECYDKASELCPPQFRKEKLEILANRALCYRTIANITPGRAADQRQLAFRDYQEALALAHRLRSIEDILSVYKGIKECLGEAGRLAEAKRFLEKERESLGSPPAPALAISLEESLMDVCLAEDPPDRVGAVAHARSMQELRQKANVRDVASEAWMLVRILDAMDDKEERSRQMSRINELTDNPRHGMPYHQRLDVTIALCQRFYDYEKQVETLTGFLRRQPEKMDRNDPDTAKIHYYLGLAHFKAGKYELAEKELSESIRCLGGDPFADPNLEPLRYLQEIASKRSPAGLTSR